MSVTLGILDGDGIGPEIVPPARAIVEECIERAGVELEFVDLPVGWEAYERYGTTLPAETTRSLEQCDGWLMGPVLSGEYPEDDGLEGNPSGTLRSYFDLYANVRPVRSYPDFGPEEMDLTIVRQNTEGFYADRNMAEGSGEFMPTEDIALSLRVVTRAECRRIAESAFRHATEKVTAVHKANVLQMGDGIFREECQRVAADYPDVELEEYLVDAFAMELVQHPEAYEVVVTTNMFGDILSDEAAGIVGSLGLAPGLNHSDEHGMAQAAHGAAPDIAGEGVANPTGMVLSAAMLLDWLGQKRGQSALCRCATTISSAVTRTISDGRVLTRDLGGTATTDEFAETVLDNLDVESLSAP